MTRSVIARVFLVGVGTFGVGVLIAAASIAVGHAGGAYVVEGADIVGVRVTLLGFASVGLAVVAALALVAASLAVLVGWAAALANARAASRFGWFAALVLLGVPTFGVGALVAYVVAGPDRIPSPA